MSYMNQTHLDLAEELGVSPDQLDREAFHKAGRCPLHGTILTERTMWYGLNESITVDYCQEFKHDVDDFGNVEGYTPTAHEEGRLL